jgi:uncharacterized membrane-anchored protein
MATGPTLPGDHPDRMALNNEVHARPPEALSERMRISYLVLFGELDMAPLRELCGRYGVEVPGPSANHFSADLGSVPAEVGAAYGVYPLLVPGACERRQPAV